jgi:hypothetical protein
MSDYAPRCPFCANVLKLQPSFWEKIGLKAAHAQCPTCQRRCEARDAETMGAAYYHWAEAFRKDLVAHLDALPVLPQPAMDRALGKPLREDTRLIPSVDELIRTCMRHQRTVLVEMARGREATLDVVHLCNEAGGGPEVVAVLGTSAAESGEREQEQLIARTGPGQFVLYNYPSAMGAEPRVKRAVHGKPTKALTEAHVAAMRAEPHAGSVKH